MLRFTGWWLYSRVPCNDLVNNSDQSPSQALRSDGFSYLQVGRLIFEARLIEDGFNLLPVEVGDPDSFDQTGIDKLLHCLKHQEASLESTLPILYNGHLAFTHLPCVHKVSVIADHLFIGVQRKQIWTWLTLNQQRYIGIVLGCRQFYRCYLQAHGPVDEIEVQVVQSKITESLLTALLYHGLFVESGPQLKMKQRRRQCLDSCFKGCVYERNVTMTWIFHPPGAPYWRWKDPPFSPRHPWSLLEHLLPPQPHSCR